MLLVQLAEEAFSRAMDNSHDHNAPATVAEAGSVVATLAPIDPVIFAALAENVFVVDIPTSIAYGQKSTQRLTSCTPLRKPYPSLEPKSGKVRGRVEQRQNAAEMNRDAQIAAIVIDALATAGQGRLEAFCHERTVRWPAVDEEQDSNRSKRKRLGPEAEREVVRTQDKHATVDPEHIDAVLKWLAQAESADAVSVEASNDSQLLIIPSHSSGSNMAKALRFKIPPRSGFANGKLVSTASTLTALSTFLSHCSHDQDTKFQLLLLDPPWPNRSARRSSTYSTYARDSHATSLDELRDSLLQLGLEDVLAPSAYVAIWITNRPAVREAALDLLAAWGAELQEEWVWTKVTEDGRPVSDPNGVWRKPWEVLLIGRRGAPKPTNVRSRVIFGVSDLHSRKPCFKPLFERLLPGMAVDASGNSKPALELFARYMVADWLSWGDEALKYQWDGWWVDS